MAYTAPTTRTTGALISASIWNTDLVNNISFLANPPACRVYHSTTQSCADDGETLLTFDSEEYDTAALHSTSTNPQRITFPVAGLYIVTAHVELASTNTYLRAYLRVLKNGTTSVAFGSQVQQNAVTRTLNLGVSVVSKFAASDEVRLYCYQVNSGAVARNASGGVGAIHFGATWVGFG